MNYTISRFEECGEQLFICINHTEKPVHKEHFFTEEEKLDQKGTIEKLVAELQVMADEYVAPLPRVSKLEEAKAFELDSKNIATAKTEYLAKRELEKEPIEEITSEEITK
jgi:hypothetical protein